MRTLLLLCAFCLVTSLVPAQETDSLRHVVCLHTTKGDIKLALYNETPFIGTTSCARCDRDTMTASSSTASSAGS